MNHCTLSSNPIRKTFIASLLAYVLLTSQLAPMAMAFKGSANRGAPAKTSNTEIKKSEAPPQEGVAGSFAPVPVPLRVTAAGLAPIISATKVDSFPDVDGDGKVSPGQTITYSVTLTNTGPDPALNLTLTDTVDPNTTIVPGSAVSTPIAFDDTYNVVGNVRIQPNAAQGLLANDNNPNTGNNTGLTASGPATSTQGGQVTINADGSFSYNPPAGFAGTDTFTYTATSANGVDTRTVTLTVGTAGAVIWFVNASAPAGGDGRLTNPFNCYTGTNCFSDTAADDPGDSIFLFSGAYTGGYSLLNNERLIGQAASDTLANIAGITVPAYSDALPGTGGASPTITTTAPATSAILLGSGNLLRGFTVGNTTGTKISGNTFGTLTVGNNTNPDVILNGSGRALGLVTGTFAATSGFVSVATTSSTAQGILLTAIAGTVSFGSTTVSGSTSQGIVVSTSTANINFGNTTVGTGTAGSGGTNSVSLQNNASGTRTFGTLTIQNNSGSGNSAFLSAAGGNSVAGATNLSGVVNNGFGIDIRALAAGTSVSFGDTTVNKTNAGAAVNLGVSGSGNAGNVTFLSLNASNTSGDALIAMENTGTITVTNNTGSLSATNGVALNITKAAAPLTTVDMDFANVSSNGATNGINLLNVGGTITTTGGALTATGTVFNLSGGTVSVTYSGNITQANNQPLLSISGGHNTGTINFNNNLALLQATGGTGAQFDNADGTYTFTSQLSCNGGDAGVDILNGSDGTFTFGSSANISNPSGVAFNVNGGTASVTYNGSIAKNNNAAATVSIVNGHSGGTITFQTNAITVGSGTGLQFSNADGTYNFSVASGNTILNGGDAGIDIVVGSSGTFTFGSGVGIVNPTGIAYQESGSTANVTYNGTITKTNNANNAVAINAKTGSTTAFNGAITASTSTANAIDLTNTGGTVNFTGGLNLTTTSGVAFNATGSGATVSATQNNTSIVNTLATTSGQALNVTNTSIGASGLTFRSIASGAGASNGITLNTTGASGGLTVTGNGTVASGGTISGKTGADSSTTSGIGVYLNSTSSVSLTRMDIEGCQNYGIRGNNVTGFTLDNSTVGATSINGTNNTADVDPTGYPSEGSIRFYNLLGSATISNSTLDLGFGKTLAVVNDTGTLNRLTITNCTVRNNQPASTVADSFFAQSSLNATLNFTVNGASVFNATRGFHITTGAQGTSTMDIQINGGCAFSNTINPLPAGGGLQFGSSGTDSLVTLNINGNSFRHGTGASPPGVNNVGRLITAGTVSGNSKFDGKILNNTFGVTGIARSGSGDGADAIGIFASGNQAGTTRGTGTLHSRFLIQGNTIKRYGETGILINARQGNSILDATVLGNTINEPGSAAQGAFAAIWVNSGALPADTNQAHIVIGSAGSPANKNTMQDSDPSNATDVFLDKNSCGGCVSQLHLYRNGSAAAGAGEALVRQILVDDNNPVLDLLAGFTNGSTITIQNGVPPAPLAPVVVTAEIPGPGASTSALVLPSLAARAAEIIPANRSASAERNSLGLGIGSKRDGGAAFRYAAVGTSAPLGQTQTRESQDKQGKGGGGKSGAPQRPNAPVQITAPSNTGATTKPTAQTPGTVVVVDPGLRYIPKPRPVAPPPGGGNPPVIVGDNLTWNVGTLPAGQSVTITFQVTVDNPFMGAMPQVSNQGTVTADGGISVLTDDPSVAGSNNPTVTGVTLPPDLFVRDARVAEPTSGSTPMLFTLALSTPAPAGGIVVNLSTANGTATGGTCVAGDDYETVSGGTATFAAGEQIKTFPVTVCSDATAEGDETFTLNVNSAPGAVIVDGTGTGTITLNQPGTILISEMRTSGPGGAGDDFVEIYNNTDTPHTIPAGGYGLFKRGADCNALPVLVGTIPAATVIPQRGHYLFVGSTYSLTVYAGGNAVLTTDIESDFNVGLFTTVDPLQVSTANRLDAVGFGISTGGVCALLLEGTPLQPAQGNTTDYSFLRELALVGNNVPTPTDGNDNAADFTVVSTTPSTPVGSTAAPRLGAPGPENLAGPNLKKYSQVGAQFIDPMLSASVAPNRARDTTPDPANNSTLGTLANRRTFTNNTGAPITRLRFRIYDITTFPSPVGTADLRARTSTNAVVTVTGVGSVTALATTLETPPAQPNSGGLNSSLAAGTVTLGTPLASGASIHLNFLFGVQQSGSFRVFVFVEAVP